MAKEIIKTGSDETTQEVIAPQLESIESKEKINESPNRLHLISRFKQQLEEAEKYILGQNDKIHALSGQLFSLKVILYSEKEYIKYLDKQNDDNFLSSSKKEELLNLKQGYDQKNSMMIFVEQRIEKLKQELEQYLEKGLSEIVLFDDQQVDTADSTVDEANTETETPCDDDSILNDLGETNPETISETRADGELPVVGECDLPN